MGNCRLLSRFELVAPPLHRQSQPTHHESGVGRQIVSASKIRFSAYCCRENIKHTPLPQDYVAKGPPVDERVSVDLANTESYDDGLNNNQFVCFRHQTTDYDNVSKPAKILA